MQPTVNLYRNDVHYQIHTLECAHVLDKVSVHGITVSYLYARDNTSSPYIYTLYIEYSI